MFGLLKLHGPILTVEDANGNVAVEENPYSWHRKHNMIYIDNPVGAGKTESEIKSLLFECLYEISAISNTVFCEIPTTLIVIP
jgi:carboxypeptidase C (cathepsin A)